MSWLSAQVHPIRHSGEKPAPYSIRGRNPSPRQCSDTSIEYQNECDEDLELREDFSADLKKSLTAVASGDTTNPAEQVAKRLGLPW